MKSLNGLIPTILKNNKILTFPVEHWVCPETIYYYNLNLISFSTLFPPNLYYLTSDILKQSDVNPKLRSYGLSNEEIGRLCQVYEFYCNKHTNLFDYDYRSKESRKEIKEHRMLKHKKEDHKVTHIWFKQLLSKQFLQLFKFRYHSDTYNLNVYFIKSIKKTKCTALF